MGWACGYAWVGRVGVWGAMACVVWVEWVKCGLAWVSRVSWMYIAEGPWVVIP